jgi:hypothetical protein
MMSQIAEAIAPVIEAAAGYRQNCIEAGFTPEAAEAMSLVYHHELAKAVMAAMFAPKVRK